jgi:murein DD-endopeptidase MepM/ murein hydrolase activator NlpD
MQIAMRIDRSRMTAALVACLAGGCGAGQVPGAGGEKDGPGRLEVRLSQGDFLHAGEARRPGSGYEGVASYHEMVLQNLAVVNVGAVPLRFEEAWIEALRGGRVVQRSRLDEDEIRATLRTYRAYAGMNLATGLDVVFNAGKIMRPGEQASEDLELAPREALVLSDSVVVTRGAPDRLRVVAHATDPQGREVTAAATLVVRAEVAKNEYSFPLEPGSWYVYSYPGIASHHRFTQATEFAIDITLSDAEGRRFRGDGLAWTDWYAYGKKVLAAADGKVVRVVSDSDLDPKVEGRQPGEALEAYWERIGERQLRRFMTPGADPVEVAAGNYVIIAHPHGEYSAYTHLARGSVRVKPGDVVRRGQHIGGVGGTGEAPQVHLHFQVAVDTDTLMGQTIPVRFVNVPAADNIAHAAEPGYWVVAR